MRASNAEREETISLLHAAVGEGRPDLDEAEERIAAVYGLEIQVRGGTVVVADRGPGLEQQDIARIFDRFYRAEAARALPGSGLGLAIVLDVAQSHAGTVFAGNRPGGGAEIGFTVGGSRVVPGRP